MTVCLSRGTEGLDSQMGNAYFLTLATESGYLHSTKDYTTLLDKVGFSTIKKIEAPYDHTILIAVK